MHADLVEYGYASQYSEFPTAEQAKVAAGQFHRDEDGAAVTMQLVKQEQWAREEKAKDRGSDDDYVAPDYGSDDNDPGCGKYYDELNGC